MSTPLPALAAENKTIPELTSWVLAGHLRIVVPQALLVWKASDVLKLLDSVYRGYPIGSLLLHQRPGPAKRFELGPLVIHAREEQHALDVVDGQQRLVSLTASLARPSPLPRTPTDPYVVYFDAAQDSFTAPPKRGVIPTWWVPVNELLDGPRLEQWIARWKHGTDPELSRTVRTAGARIRAYEVPAYVVDVGPHESDVLREIFHRVNSAGKRLSWEVVHDALYGQQEADSPSTLRGLGDALARQGMGRLPSSDLLRCLVALEGHDVTRSLDAHHRHDPAFLAGTAERARPALARVLDFLRQHAGVPHLHLLPRTTVLSILTRFFHLHPEPSARSLTLLSRWVWRTLLSDSPLDDRRFERTGVRIVSAHEEETVRQLLALVGKQPTVPTVPQRFDARAAESRLCVLALASLHPRDLVTAQPLDVAALIDSERTRAFRRLVGGKGQLQGSPANRALLPGAGIARSALSTTAYDATVMASHAISEEAHHALRRGEVGTFLALREATLNAVLQPFTERMAAWTLSDRPSIDYLLQASA
ncbi:MAG: DUF262 domain-containing protein [Polyangiales bacterium]|nr:DUF262 domain-containing protein [Sandaracinaceae bacterium]